MEYAIKQHLILSDEASSMLVGQMKIAGWLYNQLLSQANLLREEFVRSQDPEVGKRLYGKRGLRDLVPGLKEKHPFLKTVYSSPLKNAALRLCSAITEYQKSRKGKRKGKVLGWPRFHRFKDEPFSLLYDEPFKGFKIEGRSLRISLGQDENKKRLSVTAELERSLGDFGQIKIKNMRIIKEGERFCAVFSVEKVETKERKSPSNKPFKVISLDPNHKNLAYGVDSEGGASEIVNFSSLYKLDRAIDKVKSKKDRAVRKSVPIYYDEKLHHYQPSRRWIYLNNRLEKLYQKRRDQTKQFLYSIANELYKHYDVVGIGSYTPRGGGISRKMRRRMSNQSLIGRFKSILAWTAQKSGRRFLVWNEYNTTKRCSSCGRIHPESIAPDVRVWSCTNCSTLHIRDENSAINGLQIIMPEIVPCQGQRVTVSERFALSFNGHSIVKKPFTLDDFIQSAAKRGTTKQLTKEAEKVELQSACH